VSRDLILVALSLLTWGLGEGMFLFIQPLYLEVLGASPQEVGNIIGAVGVAMTVAHIPAGFLADRVGRRPLMWAAWILALVAAWVMALASSLTIFVAGLLFYSTTAFVMSPMSSYITAARGKMSVGRALTIVSASYNIGAILGPALGGWVGDQYGFQPVYLISASVFVVSTLIILLIRSQPVDRHSQHTETTRFAIDRRYLVYLGIVFLAMFVTYLPQPLSPNYLKNVHSLTVAQIGQLGSVANLGIVLLNLTLGHLPARLGFLLAQGTVAVFALALWQGTGMPAFIIGYFHVGGYRVARSLATAQTRQYTHAANMGLAYGVTETLSTSATILAPPLAGYLYTQQPTLMYVLTIGLIGISLIVSAIFAPRPEASEKLAVRESQTRLKGA
jgi:MFS family permease